MTPAEFKKKWAKFTGKESSAYQSHFDDLCRLLRVPTPLEADPAATFFCFQKKVDKDAELFAVAGSGETTGQHNRGFADVWKRGCFGWEYKGQHKDLDEAYQQLLRYRESLENPPLLVVCDFDRYVVKTNFNGTVPDIFEFTNATLDQPANWRVLRALFTDPESLRPHRTTAQVTEMLAGTIAEVAKSLHQRESVELTDAKTRKELNFAARKNLSIARFLNRIVFCFFAEDNRKVRAQHWWLLGETLPAFRRAIESLPRCIGIARVAKHRLFVWQDSVVLPDSKVIAIAFDDD